MDDSFLGPGSIMWLFCPLFNQGLVNKHIIHLGGELTFECIEHDKQIERDKDSKIDEIWDMCQSQKSVGDGYLPKNNHCSNMFRYSLQSYHEKLSETHVQWNIETMITVLPNGFWKLLQLNQWTFAELRQLVIATLQNQEGMEILAKNSKV